MRIFIFSIVLIFSSCSSFQRRPASDSHITKVNHMVLDIDWTITSEVANGYKGKRIIQVEDKSYFIHDGLEEFVENLLKKDFKVSFFSGGSLKRNKELLTKIKLRDGKSLADIAYKILSKEDLTINPNAVEGDKFSVRFKKDITKVSTDLSNLVMIDDTLNFVLPDQTEHVIHTGKTFNHFENFEETKALSGEYIPKSIGEWSFARKKLIIFNGALDQAYTESQEKGISFKEAFKIETGLLQLESGEWSPYSRKMFRLGLATSQCSEAISSFIKLPANF